MLTYNKYRKIVNEMSMIIPKMDDHRMNNITDNKAEYDKFSDSVELEYSINKEINLYLGDYGKSGVYLAADPNKGQIYYFMKYKRDSEPKLGKFVKQSWVWIDKNYKNVVGELPKKMFYELLDNYTTIVADTDQTPDGRDFWKKRLKEAFDKHYFVYYYNSDKETIERLDNNLDVEKFDNKYGIWTELESSWDKVFVISKKQLVK
jgi:hypothetical protein